MRIVVYSFQDLYRLYIYDIKNNFILLITYNKYKDIHKYIYT